METKEKNGFLLIVYGSPYYGRFAFNLAVSIKAVEFEIPIAVVHAGEALSHLSEDQKLIFDYVIDMPESINTDFGAKLQIDKLTPFENTIFLDSDTVWLPKQKPSELFNILEPYEFTAITEGFYDVLTATDNGNKKYYYWADIEEIVKIYKPKNKVFQFRSEFIYFKQTDNIKKLFKKAREVYKNPKLKSVRRFAHHIPDELALNVAAAVLDINPHAVNWSASYWPVMHRNVIPDFETLYSYYILSCGSNTTPQGVINIYNSLLGVACKKLNYQHIFLPKSKRQFDTQRLKM